MSRAELRKSRWDLARELGFSAKEARAMRDWSANRIRGQIQSTRQNLESTPARQRSESERQRLREIRRYFRRQRDDVDFRDSIATESDRIDHWRQWSDRHGRGFPTDMLREILDYNDSQGLPEFASFGYRVRYARYVMGMSESEALTYALYDSEPTS